MKTVIPGVAAVAFMLGSMTAMAEAPAQAAENAASEQAPSQEQKPANPFAAEFMRLDVNRDGSIDSKEAKADKALGKSFGKLSKNGKLSEEQYIKWAETQKKG